MENLKILAISILVLSCSTNRNVITDLEKIGLAGQVESIKFDRVRNNKEKEDENTFHIDNELYFNKNGMISEQRLYSSKGLINIHSFIYDEKNLLISKNYYNGLREFVGKSKFENIISSKGKLTKQSEYRALGNPVIDSTNIKFNLFAYEITEFLYDSNGNLNQYNVYNRMSPYLKDVTVLNNGQIVKNSIIEVEGGDLFSETNYKCVKYDTRNNCTKYKLTSNDSTESYINVKIGYYK